jgi:hypothetical protein
MFAYGKGPLYEESDMACAIRPCIVHKYLDQDMGFEFLSIVTMSSAYKRFSSPNTPRKQYIRSIKPWPKTSDPPRRHQFIRTKQITYLRLGNHWPDFLLETRCPSIAWTRFLRGEYLVSVVSIARNYFMVIIMIPPSSTHTNILIENVQHTSINLDL